ncbi:MAG: tRNA (guanosine(46)-N7)-methyltransferase TrmB [Balneolales bacterium]
MSKNKLYRYAQVKKLRNVIELSNYKPGDYARVRGKWAKEIFCSDKPLTLELACGKGDYVLALARQHPELNFIGIDIKGDRLVRGAQYAENKGLTNVIFLRVFIDHIDNYFAPAEVSDIWITFPDPYASTTKEMKRLTSPPFLEKYRRIAGPGHNIHLKTDDPGLFRYTLETLASHKGRVLELNEDVYAAAEVPDILNIQTYYERKHLEAGKIIRYVRFSLG